MKKLNAWWMRYNDWAEHTMLGAFFSFVLTMTFVVLASFFAIKYGLKYFGTNIPQESDSKGSADMEDESCSVMGINLHGRLMTYIPNISENDSFADRDVVGSENILLAIQRANDDPKMRAIIIEVDSGGGSPVAGEEVANAIKNSDKPIVAFIRGVGASAAYWAISSAEKIFASKNSDIGSIGVTMSYLNETTKNSNEGITFEQLSSGKYKDTGNQDKPLTTEERALLLRDINIVYENFVEAVSQNRNLPIGKVRSMADGSTVLGEKAKALGLIDEIGGISEVEMYLEEKIGEKVDICWN